MSDYNGIVFFDFNGVLDVKNSWEITDYYISQETKKRTDPEKAYILLKFIKDNKLGFCSISAIDSFGCSVSEAIIASLRDSGNEEYQKFAEEFYEYLEDFYFADGFEKCAFPNRANEKNNLVKSVMDNYPDMKCVVFEDEYEIDKIYNWFQIDSSKGLSQEVIDKAKLIFEN